MSRRLLCASLVAALVLLAGCRGRPLPKYDDEQGFHFEPPPGWSERARPAAGAASAPRKQPDLPLPPLDTSTPGMNERLLVRYDRLTAGRLAWLRVSTANVPAAFSLETWLAARAPRPAWRRQGDVERIEMSEPAARVAFTGRWGNLDYLCEIVGVRKGEQVWFFTAGFPAADSDARDQVRKAIAAARWK